MERTGLTPEEAKPLLDAQPRMNRATYRIPQTGVAAGMAANTLLHLAGARPARQAA
jgi:hypothetical protein